MGANTSNEPGEIEVIKRFAESRQSPRVERRFEALAKRLGITDYKPAVERADSRRSNQ